MRYRGLVRFIAFGTGAFLVQQGCVASKPSMPTLPAASLVVTQAAVLSASSGVPFSVQPVVQLTDVNGGNVAQPGTVVSVSMSAGGGGLGGSTTVPTGSDGAARFKDISISGAVGTRTLVFSAAGLKDGTATVTLLAGPVAALVVNVGNNQSSAPGTAVSIAPAVEAVDAQRNAVSGVLVAFAVSSGGGSISVTSTSTGNDGIASAARWTLGPTAGPNTLVASSAGLAPVLFSATATPVATKLAVTTAPSTSTPSRQLIATQPVIQLQDAGGNAVPLSGKLITVAITSGGGILSGATSATTTGSGAASFSNLSIAGAAGARTLTFSSPGYTSTAASVTVLAGPPSTLVMNGGNGQSAAAGTAVAVAPSVKVTDVDGNAIGGVAITFAVTSGAGSIVAASQTTNVSGIAAVGNWTLGTVPGTNSIIASAAGLAGSPVTFTATGTLQQTEWRIALVPAMDSGSCTGTAGTNQTFDFLPVFADAAGAFRATWTEGASPFTVVVATGTVTPTTFAASLICGNGTGTPGSMSATWTGSRYDGTFSFRGSVGTIVVTRVR